MSPRSFRSNGSAHETHRETRHETHRETHRETPGADVMKDRGAADALGLVLIAPVIIGFALLVLALGRGVDATAQVRSAAEAAAQAAALERNQADAAAAATATARAMLDESSNCDDPTVVTAFAPDSSINNGLVRVTVGCQVSNRGVEVIFRDPYSEVVTAVAPIDFFRADR